LFSSRCNPIKMDDFIESMLKERRSLEEGSPILWQSTTVSPPNNERCAWERIIESLKAEISLRSLLRRSRDCLAIRLIRP
jgi:hypothetical protein